MQMLETLTFTRGLWDLDGLIVGSSRLELKATGSDRLHDTARSWDDELVGHTQIVQVVEAPEDRMRGSLAPGLFDPSNRVDTNAALALRK